MLKFLNGAELPSSVEVVTFVLVTVNLNWCAMGGANCVMKV